MWNQWFTNRFTWRYCWWYFRIAGSSKAKYSYIDVVICGIMPRDNSWIVNWVSIKDVNQILKLKCYKSSYNFVSYNSGWTFANDSLNEDLYYSERLHLVEKENLKLAESIFHSIDVSHDITCSNHNEFSDNEWSIKNGCVFHIKQRWFSSITFSFCI